MNFCAELKDICKSFGDHRANSDVCFQIEKGSIHALLGENGAGKSTAMKILFGLLPSDSGELRIFGNAVTRENWNPRAAFEAGIGMVHQHFMLAPTETVLDNLVLGVEQKQILFFRSRKNERKKLETLMQKTGLFVPLDEKVQNLPVGMQSRCEILKVLYRDAKLLILDEPTAVLTPGEIGSFLDILKTLRSQGISILIVTHKLDEVMAVADRATVLRDGKVVGNLKISETNPEKMAELMVGRSVYLPKNQMKLGPDLVLRELGMVSLFPGEILGIAGVEGSGQEALIEKIAKAIPRNHLSLIPGDRLAQGLVLDFDLVENYRLGREQLKKSLFSRVLPASSAEIEKMKTYDVRPLDPKMRAGSLSGGNQQKLIAAREIPEDLSESNVLVAHHPTRGIDVGSIEVIHGKILDFAKAGGSVLLISSELEELMRLSHRIAVMYKGRMVKFFDGPDYEEGKIGEAMLGVGNA